MDTHKSGRSGEQTAETYLVQLGYTFIDRNYKVYPGEIDLILLDGETLVFVEVKAWKNYSCFELEKSVMGKKRERIISVAQIFISRNWELYKNSEVRFDVVFIDGLGKITHYKNVFQ